MLTRTMLFLTVLAVTPSLGLAQSTSPNGVRTLDPPGAIKAEGTWSLGVRAGDFVFVAGMQGMDPATNALVKDPQARILRAFLNLKLIAESEGASLQHCVRLTVYVSDLHRYAPMVEKAQAELWGKPPRTISRFSACSTTTSSRSIACSMRQRRSERVES